MFARFETFSGGPADAGWTVWLGDAMALAEERVTRLFVLGASAGSVVFLRFVGISFVATLLCSEFVVSDVCVEVAITPHFPVRPATHVRICTSHFVHGNELTTTARCHTNVFQKLEISIQTFTANYCKEQIGRLTRVFTRIHKSFTAVFILN